MKTRHSRAMEIFVFILLLTSQSASAATSSGAGALALAALLALHSPISSLYHRSVLERLLDGDSNVAFPANQKISVAADAIVCNAGDVDITAHSCKLTFGAKTANLTGRKAHELYATIAEAGVSSQGSPGTIYESLSHLVCTIDPHEVAQKGGGGANCTFDMGAAPIGKSNP
jgi:hypothetical protein